MNKKEAFIIGTGIAGVSLGEILSRNGYKVFLLENSDKIGGEASLATQKWFHTGWLYAALPDQSATLGCNNAVKLFNVIYANKYFKNKINIRIDKSGVNYIAQDDGWFNNERINYIFAKSSYEFNLFTKIYWPLYLKFVYLSRIKKLNYKINELEPDELTKELLNIWENKLTGYKNYSIIESTDAKIKTDIIIRDLILSMNEETEIITNANYKLSNRNNYSEIEINGKSYKPSVLIIASGKSIPKHLKIIGADDYANQIKSIKSPILVLKDVLPYLDFIRYTPIVEHTVNHIKFNILNNKKISTIGSYFSFPIEEKVEISFYENLMLKMLAIDREQLLGSYYGIKTEFTGARDRRYNHTIKKINANTYFALAGKFSQFPLLVNDFITQEGLSLEEKSDISRIKLDNDIFASLYPEDIVLEKLKNKE